ncbi:HET-domain-containing protein [Melanomma pulvis-pyrius CBS 109.77]|uniref:HET-domain-containing protein n=1 Tax=Melanomma pulvis-pyrius CBS 109.77 TaxID=1314802 RepID=A0A6A6WV12_9PLEO|nr:HET-domain-containing protein [Melanomma pulvis-pyrius CBS 109.77]
MLPVTENLDDVFSATTNPGQLNAAEEERKTKLRSVFEDPIFKDKPRDDFCLHQWAFISPVFASDKFLSSNFYECFYTFDSLHRMPFIKKALSTFRKTSNFSEVEKILIHRDHLQREDVELSSTDYHPIIALKKLTKLDLNDEEFMEAVQMEAENLQKLQSLNHPHLIKAIAWFTWGKTHYFMFPWANLGNLRDYCAMEPPNLTDSYLQWIFLQFCGLADAIMKLHGSDKSSASWRHGDLKPDNILCFGNSHEPPDSRRSTCTFVITDVGLTKRHNFITEDRNKATSTRMGTFMYEPPETELDQHDPNKGRSRRYDIWSMGCIYLEFIIWLLYGPKGLDSFSGGLGSSKRFYAFDSSKKPKLHNVVEVWVNHIKKDLRCPSDTALGSLLDLVIKGLLNTDLGQISTIKRSATMKQSNGNASELPKFLIPPPTALSQSTSFPNSSPDGRMSAEEMVKGMKEIFTKATASNGTKIEWMKFNEQAQSPLDDKWKYDPDTEIARALASDINTHYSESQYKDRSRLCGRCARLEFWLPRCDFSDTPAGLEKNAKNCALCLLLHRGISKYVSADDSYFEFSRVGSSMVCSALSGQPVATIYTLPKFEDTLPGIQLSLPELSEPGSQFNINIIREWIRRCDQSHSCVPRNTTFLPTRVLDVGDEHSSSVRLTCIDREHTVSGKYLALSHRWGSPTTNTLFRTLKSNLATFKKAIEVAHLPKTFQQAVKISRKMNIQYLWIDSLCIVQDDAEDWDRESERMEQVFSSAYATIAATCASGTHDGFLKKRPERQSVKMAKGDSSYFVCEAIDNFHKDVDQADLNKRGWVLQERALSRRTIHFTETQCYWECGGGVRCETLTKMKNRKASFLGDANFPRSVESDVKGMKIEFFQDLYSKYSKLALTYCADRPIAIRGLERRIIQSLNTKGAYGVFDIPYFHRCLLWKRSGTTLKKITTFHGDIVPSWSWMAYQGGIDYMDAPGGRVDWAKDVSSPFTQLNAPGSANVATHAKISAPIHDFINTETRDFIFDEPDRNFERPLKCVIVGKSKDSTPKDRSLCYVLVVQAAAAKETDKYERVGVALLKQDRIAFKDSKIVVSIQ